MTTVLKLIPAGFVASLAIIAMGDREWTLAVFFGLVAIAIGIAFMRCLP